jgi:hypothetical protein
MGGTFSSGLWQDITGIGDAMRDVLFLRRYAQVAKAGAVRPARFSSTSTHPLEGEARTGCGPWSDQSTAAQPDCDPSNNPSTAAQPGYDPSNNPSTAAQPGYDPSSNQSTAAQPDCCPSNDPSTAAQPDCCPSNDPSTAAQPGYDPWNDPSTAAQPGYDPWNDPSTAAQPGYDPWQRRGGLVAGLLPRDCAPCCFHQIRASDPPVLSADTPDPGWSPTFYLRR